AGGRVTLPGIALRRDGENLPYVKKFEVEITGRSTPLTQEGEVDRIAGRLKFGYPKLDYRPGKEVALRQQMTVPLNRVVLEGKIPPGARFTMTVEVWYYDSDAQGRPNTSLGVQGRVKHTSVLLLASPEIMVAGVAQVAGPCRIEVEPAQLTLVDRGDPAVLTIRTANRPADAIPRLVLADLFV